MKKIGSWWLARFAAQAGEEVLFSIFANRTQSSSRAVGGKLFITNRRCLFAPHLFDYVLGGEKCELNLADIMKVEREPSGGDVFGGGLRDRLYIQHKGGHELFVVNHLDSVIQKITAHVENNAADR